MWSELGGVFCLRHPNDRATPKEGRSPHRRPISRRSPNQRKVKRGRLRFGGRSGVPDESGQVASLLGGRNCSSGGNCADVVRTCWRLLSETSKRPSDAQGGAISASPTNPRRSPNQRKVKRGRSRLEGEAESPTSWGRSPPSLAAETVLRAGAASIIRALFRALSATAGNRPLRGGDGRVGSA